MTWRDKQKRLTISRQAFLFELHKRQLKVEMAGIEPASEKFAPELLQA